MDGNGPDRLATVLLLPVRRVMRRDFVTVPPAEPLREAYQLMRFARLRHLLVEENGHLIGILSFRDLQEALLAPLDGHRPLGRVRPGDPVSAAMRTRPYAITPDTPLRDAASRLCSLRIGCLPVVESLVPQPALIGIVTETDLLLAAFEHP